MFTVCVREEVNICVEYRTALIRKPGGFLLSHATAVIRGQIMSGTMHSGMLQFPAANRMME